MDTASNFGIKNQTPTEALDVTGNAKVSGTITSGGSAVVLATGNQTIAGNKTFSGQTELTGQAATNSTSAMTRGLGDTRYGEEVRSFSSSDQSITSSTTLTDLTDLSITLGVGTWEIETKIYFNVATTSPGAKFACAFSGTRTAYRGHTEYNTGTVPGISQSGYYTATGTFYSYPGNPVGLGFTSIRAVMTVSVEGVFKIQFAQFASSADALTVYSPSMIKARRF